MPDNIDKIIKQTEYNDLDKLSSKFHNVGLTLYGTSLASGPFGPLLRIAGGLSDLGGDVTDYINDRIGVAGLLGRTALNTAGVIVPGTKNINKAGKFWTKLNNFNEAITSPGKSIIQKSILIAPNKYARFGLGVGTGLGITYLPQGAFNAEGDNVITGTKNAILRDINNIQEGSAAENALKIISIPLFLRHPKSAKAVSTASTFTTEGNNAASTVAAEGSNATTAARTAATARTATNVRPVTSPSSMSAAEAFEANSPAVAALITSGGLGVASTAKALNKNNNKSSSWLRRLRDTPKTITGTYTGKPIDTSLTKGLIIGRKNGGLLKELRK